MSQSITEGAKAGNEDRYLGEGTEAEATETCWLWTCSPWLVQPTFTYNPVPTVQGWQHPQWAEPYYVNQ